MSRSSVRAQVLEAVRAAAGDAVLGDQLAAVRDPEDRNLWHVAPDLGPIVQIGGTVYIVHAPTRQVFEVPGSLPPEVNAEAVRTRLAESAG